MALTKGTHKRDVSRLNSRAKTIYCMLSSPRRGLVRASLGSSAPPHHMTVLCIDAQGLTDWTDCRYRRDGMLDQSARFLLPLTGTHARAEAGTFGMLHTTSFEKEFELVVGLDLLMPKRLAPLVRNVLHRTTEAIPAQRQTDRSGPSAPNAPAPIIMALADRADNARC